MFGKMRAQPCRPGITFRTIHGGGEITHAFRITIDGEKRVKILIPPGAEDQAFRIKRRGVHARFLAQSGKHISP